jgi:hypothetical protein
MRGFFDEQNLTRNDQSLKLELVGSTYDVWELLQIPPVRSGNLIVHEMKIGKYAFNSEHETLWHAIIEIRKAGIEIHIHSENKHFSWCIPFYRLVIFQSIHYTIHSDGDFIRFKSGIHSKRVFFRRMLDEKIRFLGS